MKLAIISYEIFIGSWTEFKLQLLAEAPEWNPFLKKSGSAPVDSKISFCHIK